MLARNLQDCLPEANSWSPRPRWQSNSRRKGYSRGTDRKRRERTQAMLSAVGRVPPPLSLSLSHTSGYYLGTGLASICCWDNKNLIQLRERKKKSHIALVYPFFLFFSLSLSLSPYLSSTYCIYFHTSYLLDCCICNVVEILSSMNHRYFGYGEENALNLIPVFCLFISFKLNLCSSLTSFFINFFFLYLLWVLWNFWKPFLLVCSWLYEEVRA